MRLRTVARLATVLLGLASPLAAQTPAAPEVPVLRIGTHAAPPFAMRGEGGGWEGISIALLDEVATRAGFRYELVEGTLPEMTDGPASGRLDGAIAAITPTPERERVVDFTDSYFLTGLAAAVPEVRPLTFRDVLGALASREFSATLQVLLGLTLVAGTLVWLLERRQNPGEFERSPGRGLFSGFWWATVTMTTVGYGDKTPITVAGRLVAIVWMILTLGLVALATAHLSATLTAERLSAGLTAPAALSRVRVGALADGPALQPLHRVVGRVREYPSVLAGLQAVQRGEIDAFVHDEPVLAWERDTVGGISIAPLRFSPETYVMVLSPGSPWREKINQAILDTLASEQWLVTLRYYLGPE